MSLFRGTLIKSIGFSTLEGLFSRGLGLRVLRTEAIDQVAPTVSEFGRTANIVGANTLATWLPANSGHTGHLIRVITGGTTGVPFGWMSPSDPDCRLTAPGIFGFTMSVPAAMTNIRYWILLADGDPDGNDDPAGLNLLGFRASSGVDTNWQACAKDGTTLALADTGVPFVVDRSYTFLIDTRDPTRIDYYINLAKVASITANLPAVSVDMACSLSGVPKAAITKAIGCTKIECWVG